MALEAVGSNPIIHPILKSNLRVAFFAKKEQKMLKKVMIKITSKCEELADSLFERYFGGDNFEEGDFEADDYALEEALNAVADVEFDFGNEEKEWGRGRENGNSGYRGQAWAAVRPGGVQGPWAPPPPPPSARGGSEGRLQRAGGL